MAETHIISVTRRANNKDFHQPVSDTMSEWKKSLNY